MKPGSRDIAGPEWFERSGRAAWLFLGLCGAAAVVVFSIQWLSSIVIPLVLASFLSAVFAPAVDWLERRRVPRSLGAAIVVLAVIGVFVGSLALVVVGIVNNADELAAQFDAAQVQLADLTTEWDLDGYIDQIRSNLEGGSGIATGIGTQVGSAAGSVVAFFSGLALGLVLFYYLLRDGRSLVRSMIRQWRPNRATTLERIIRSSIASTQAYMRGRTILALVQGVAVGVVLWIMGVPLPLAIGIVTFITAYIPYIGAFVGGAFAVVMALAGGGVADAVWALAVVLFVNVVLENALEPMLTGSSLDMHPVVVLLVTVGGGLIAGVVGFVLASPITAIIRHFYRELNATGFFDETSSSEGDSR